MNQHAGRLDFAQIGGTIFNEVTTALVGGSSGAIPDNAKPTNGPNRP
jgi:hypothetical protein